MKKILVIGSGGAGKSTFARRLRELTGLELIHLDRLYWKPNWTETPPDEWSVTIEKILEQDGWIMDGNFGGTLELRLTACDTVIFFDLPRTVCLYRALKRWRMYWGTNRPDMSEGCNEKVDLEFLGWIWNFPKLKKPKIEALLKKFENEKTIIRFKSSSEVESFLKNCKTPQTDLLRAG